MLNVVDMVAIIFDMTCWKASIAVYIDVKVLLVACIGLKKELHGSMICSNGGTNAFWKTQGWNTGSDS